MRRAGRYLKPGGLVAALALGYAVPYVVDAFILGTVTLALIYALLAQSINLIGGYGGLMSLGQAGILATAAYGVGYSATHLHLGYTAQVLVGLAAGLGVSLLFGLMAMRTSGVYFLMITLAQGVIVYGLANSYAPVTGGADGLTGVYRPPAVVEDWQFYYVCLACLVACTALIRLIVRSPFGLALRGLRESDSRLRALGYSPAVMRLYGFVLAGFFAGVSGVLFAYNNEFVSPSAAEFTTSAQAVLMIILGGIGTLSGPVIGALAIVFAQNVLSLYVGRWPTVMGLVFIVMMLFARDGFVGGVRRLWARVAPAPSGPPDSPVDGSRPDTGPEPAAPTGDERLVLDGVTVRFGGLIAVREVSLRVRGGERWAVIGPNGAGKTTLFRTIAGEQAPSRGRVRLFGRDVTRRSADRRARAGLGRTYQVTNVFGRLTVAENVALAAQAGRRRRMSCWWPLRLTGALGERVDATLERVGLAHCPDRPARELSHGEQRQLELALGLAGAPRLLLLDEPAAGLSAAERVVMARLVRDLPPDLAVVLIEHDMSLALDLVDKVLCMDDGHVIAVGSPDQIRADELVQSVYLKSD